MKAIINGIRYDTEKATLIGETDNCGGSVSRSDFRYWEAGLYVTPRSGRYFLAGRGGAMSRFSRKVDTSTWSGGSGIVPMDRADALEFASAELPIAKVEEFFGDIIEDA